jgi:preprotein translocase subunit Sss1
VVRVITGVAMAVVGLVGFHGGVVG